MHTSKEITALERTARDIRQRIIDKAARDGGHVASPLGAVELILAVVEIFDLPRDGVFFDIGHYVDAYKLITGRADQYDTLDHFGGMSRFPKIAESDYDFFGTGHSGTSISAAIAYAMTHPEAQAVAVIGDGAFTGGQPFEAMNQAGDVVSNLTIIYNENGYSSTENTGSLARYGRLREYAHSLGFDYIEVLAGHDLNALGHAFLEAKDASRPTFVRVCTQKGYGYPPAMTDPIQFHSSGAFDQDTGKALSETKTEVYQQYMSLFEEQKSLYPNLYALSPAAERDTGLFLLKEKYPEAIIDTGINEQHCVTLATALSVYGNPVICVIPAPFLLRAADQLVDASIQKASFVLILPREGVSLLGPTHHGIYHQSLCRMLPGIDLVYTSDWSDFKTTVAEGLRTPGIQCLVPPVPSRVVTSPPPKRCSVQMVQEGGAVAIVVIGHTQMGLSPEVCAEYNLSYVVIRQPGEAGTQEVQELVSAHKIQRVLVLEDCLRPGMYGYEVAYALRERAEVQLVGLDEYPPQGSSTDVREALQLSESYLIQRLRQWQWIS